MVWGAARMNRLKGHIELKRTAVLGPLSTLHDVILIGDVFKNK